MRIEHDQQLQNTSFLLHSSENMSEVLQDNSKTEKTAFNIIKTWFLNSPTHGIRRISRANSIPGRLFWSFTFLIFTTLMSIFIYTVIMNFIAHPTKISLSVRQYRDPDHIPTVTFCKEIFLKIFSQDNLVEIFRQSQSLA